MRAAIVACSVAGTSTSAASRAHAYCAAVAVEHAALGQVADDLLGEERVAGGAFGDLRRSSAAPKDPHPAARRSAPRICESSSGASAIVCAPGIRSSAPRYSGR